MIKTLIFIATYNENLNISNLLKRIINISLDYDILVIDDNSEDGSRESLEKLCSIHSCLKVINRPRKMGVGSAHRAAMIYACKNEYKELITMDADFSHSPDAIPLLLEELKTSDFVIGSRYVKGGKCDYTGYRKWVSLLANQVARRILGIKINECTTSFRAFRVDLIRSLNLSSIRSNGYSFFLECVFEIGLINTKISEVPIHFQDRFQGNSKIPKTEIIRSMYKLTKLALSRIYRKQTDLTNPAEINCSCYLCGSVCVVEVNNGNSNNQNYSSEAFNCTSFAHKSKPKVLNCLICDLSFVPESSSPMDIISIYSEVKDFTYLENKNSRYKTFQKSLAQISPYFNEKGALLEVGSYCGFFLDVFKKQFPRWDYIGIEPSKWASEYARNQLKINTKTGSLEENISKLNSVYDVVVSWDVLEHLKDPLEFLISINSVMKKDGIFCFSTLDIDNWFPKIMGRHWPWLMDMHLFYYNISTTEELLKKSGFKIIGFEKYVHYVSIHYFFRKIISILPGRIGMTMKILENLMPQKIMVPIGFGDIKLYICQKH